MDYELGSVVAYRGWCLDRQISSRIPTLRAGLPSLSSISGDLGTNRWPYGVIKALCPSGHDAPEFDCSCGIYSFRENPTPLTYATRTPMPGRTPWTAISGEIDIFGKVIIHKEGYRSEYAKVRKLNRRVVCLTCALHIMDQVSQGISRIDDYTYFDLDDLEGATDIRVWTVRAGGYERLSLVMCHDCQRRFMQPPYLRDGVHPSFKIRIGNMRIIIDAYREIAPGDLSKWFLQTAEMYESST